MTTGCQSQQWDCACVIWHLVLWESSQELRQRSQNQTSRKTTVLKVPQMLNHTGTVALLAPTTVNHRLMPANRRNSSSVSNAFNTGTCTVIRQMTSVVENCYSIISHVLLPARILIASFFLLQESVVTSWWLLLWLHEKIT
jgi:hypothetical protein